MTQLLFAQEQSSYHIIFLTGRWLGQAKSIWVVLSPLALTPLPFSLLCSHKPTVISLHTAIRALKKKWRKLGSDGRGRDRWVELGHL